MHETRPALEKEEEVLHWSVRPDLGDAPPLSGPALSTLSVDNTAPVLIQLDTIHEGVVSGWACDPNQVANSLKVRVFVDGVQVGEVVAGEPMASHVDIVRLCRRKVGLDVLPLAFRAKLPQLAVGRHELRAYASADGVSWKSAPDAPMAFRESRDVPDAETALARKDAIILRRNAQLAACWKDRDLLGFVHNQTERGGRGAARPYAMVVGVNTGLLARPRRDLLRKTWFPDKETAERLEKQGVVVRFVVGTSQQANDPALQSLREESEQFGDLLEMPDLVDAYSDLSLKTQIMFETLTRSWDADFYFKVDDDVLVNLGALADYVRQQAADANMYVGCMKSGVVLQSDKLKWHEPEWWRFGDALGPQGINYPRHASGQAYGLSNSMARYIADNRRILHRYANEDVSVGTWMLGLNVDTRDERRMCCATLDDCRGQQNPEERCLVFSEAQCAGICDAANRLVPLWDACMKDPETAAKLDKLP